MRRFRGRTIYNNNLSPNNTNLNKHIQNNIQVTNIDDININWTDIIDLQFKYFPYTDNSEIHSDVYSFIVDDELLNLIVTMTNKNAKTKKPN